MSLAQKWPLNECETLDTKLLLRLGHGHDPWVLLLRLGLVSADNLASLAALLQVLLLEATCGVVSGTVHNLGPRADSLGVSHLVIDDIIFSSGILSLRRKSFGTLDGQQYPHFAYSPTSNL